MTRGLLRACPTSKVSRESHEGLGCSIAATASAAPLVQGALLPLHPQSSSQCCCDHRVCPLHHPILTTTHRAWVEHVATCPLHVLQAQLLLLQFVDLRQHLLVTETAEVCGLCGACLAAHNWPGSGCCPGCCCSCNGAGAEHCDCCLCMCG